MGIASKLEGVLRDLASLEEQGNVEGFFNNVVNADKLGGLNEDIRDAMMEYQVCTCDLSAPALLTFAPDLVTARHLRQELSAHRGSHPYLSSPQTNR